MYEKLIMGTHTYIYIYEAFEFVHKIGHDIHVESLVKKDKSGESSMPIITILNTNA
jgi:hypothetical protein